MDESGKNGLVVLAMSMTASSLPAGVPELARAPGEELAGPAADAVEGGVRGVGVGAVGALAAATGEEVPAIAKSTESDALNGRLISSSSPTSHLALGVGGGPAGGHAVDAGLGVAGGGGGRPGGHGGKGTEPRG